MANKWRIDWTTQYGEHRFRTIEWKNDEAVYAMDVVFTPLLTEERPLSGHLHRLPGNGAGGYGSAFGSTYGD